MWCRADSGYNQPQTERNWERGELVTRGIINGQNSWNLFAANSAVADAATTEALAVINQADQSVMNAT